MSCSHFKCKFDDHKLCRKCRKCDNKNPCSVCRDWPESYWDTIEKNRLKKLKQAQNRIAKLAKKAKDMADAWPLESLSGKRKPVYSAESMEGSGPGYQEKTYPDPDINTGHPEQGDPGTGAADASVHPGLGGPVGPGKGYPGLGGTEDESDDNPGYSKTRDTKKNNDSWPSEKSDQEAIIQQNVYMGTPGKPGEGLGLGISREMDTQPNYTSSPRKEARDTGLKYVWENPPIVGGPRDVITKDTENGHVIPGSEMDKNTESGDVGTTQKQDGGQDDAIRKKKKRKRAIRSESEPERSSSPAKRKKKAHKAKREQDGKKKHKKHTKRDRKRSVPHDSFIRAENEQSDQESELDLSYHAKKVDAIEKEQNPSHKETSVLMNPEFQLVLAKLISDTIDQKLVGINKPNKETKQILDETMNEVSESFINKQKEALDRYRIPRKRADESPKGQERHPERPKGRARSPSPSRKRHSSPLKGSRASPKRPKDRGRSPYRRRSNSRDSEDSDSTKRSQSPKEAGTEVSEEKKESLNVPLQDQLLVLNMLFPEEVKLNIPESDPTSQIERPEMKTKDPEVSSLPLHRMIQRRLDTYHKDMLKNIKSDSSKVKRESVTLNTNKFPKPYRLDSKYKPEGKEKFFDGYLVDSKLNKLIPENKIKSAEKQRALDVTGAAHIVSDLNKSLASTSWNMWMTEANNIVLKQLHQQLSDKTITPSSAADQIQMILNLSSTSLQASKYAVEQQIHALGNATLAIRDAFLLNTDREVDDTSKLTLRNAPFNGKTLFNDTIEEAVKELKDTKQTKAISRPLQVNVNFPGGQTQTKTTYQTDYSKKESRDYSKRNNRGAFQNFQNNWSRNNNNNNNNNNNQNQNQNQNQNNQGKYNPKGNSTWNNFHDSFRGGRGRGGRGGYRGRGRGGFSR